MNSSEVNDRLLDTSARARLNMGLKAQVPYAER